MLQHVAACYRLSAYFHAKARALLRNHATFDLNPRVYQHQNGICNPRPDSMIKLEAQALEKKRIRTTIG